MKRRERSLRFLTESLTIKMFAAWLLGLMLFSLVSLSSSPKAHAQSLTGFKTYTMPQYGVVLQYPEDWAVAEESETEVYFSRPDSNTDEEILSLSFGVLDATDVESIEDFTDDLVTLYESYVADFEKYESVPTKLGKYSGHRIVFFATVDNITMKTAQAYALIEDKIYLITYAAPMNEYQNSWPDVSKMISSFEIDTTIIPVKVGGGMYANEEFGLKINFPEGWNGAQVKNDNGTSVALVPEDGRKLSMVLTVVDTSKYSPGGSEDPLSGCTTTIKLDEINDMSSISYEGECDRAEGFLVMKAYMFALDRKLVIAMLIAPSRTAFDSGVDEFDEAVQTLELKNSTNVFSTLMYSAGKNLQNVTVEYVNARSGVSMQLPEGWRGFVNTMDKTTSVMILPPLTEKEAAMITLDVIDKSSYSSEYETEFVGSIQHVLLNGVSALRADGQLEVQKIELRSIGYILTTEDKLISIAYSAPATVDFGSYQSEFEHSLETLVVKDAVDITAYLPLSVDFNNSEQAVTVDDKPYGVKVVSTSNVTDIVLNEEERQLSVALEGTSPGNGTSFITVSAILEGPFVVTIDGAPADFDVLNSSGSGQTTIAVNHPRDTESIVVAGTRVIPEFPLGLFATIAIVTGLAIIMTRAITYRLPSGQ